MAGQIVTVPRDLMRATLLDWDIDWGGQTAGVTSGNMTQTTLNAFPRWIGFLSLRARREVLLSWRALRDAAQGKVNLYRLPLIDPVAYAPPVAGVPFSNGAGFAEGALFLADPFCTLALAASAGATTLVFNTASTSVAPVVGQVMSIDDWPFRIVSITSIDGDLMTVQIAMPLRAAADAGSMAMMQATGLFEVVDPAPGAMGYGATHIATPSLTFIEALQR